MVMQTDPKSLNNGFLNRRWMTFFFNSSVRFSNLEVLFKEKSHPAAIQNFFKANYRYRI